jgi:immune inhibitor A
LYEGHGLLAMHIAYNKHTVSMTDYPNKTKGIPRVCIVPADGLVIHGDLIGDGKPHTTSEYFSSLEGDPFPGTSNVTELTAEQNLPNYKFYNDLNDDTDDTVPVFKLLNITENTETGVVTFDFDNGTPSAIAEVKSLQSTGDGALYDLQGRKWSNGQLPKGLYIQNGKKITVR